jgi:4-amino-4-deoxy-L-arabinose transferase-like glycosyltransferase
MMVVFLLAAILIVLLAMVGWLPAVLRVLAFVLGLTYLIAFVTYVYLLNPETAGTNPAGDFAGPPYYDSYLNMVDAKEQLGLKRSDPIPLPRERPPEAQ